MFQNVLEAKTKVLDSSHLHAFYNLVHFFVVLGNMGNCSILQIAATEGRYISLTPSPWTTTMDYRNGLPKWTAKWTTEMDYPKLPVTGRFDRRSFRSKFVSIETKSQFDRRVNVYKNYSFASV